MNNKLFCTAQCGGACITRKIIDMSKIQKATHDSKLNHIESQPSQILTYKVNEYLDRSFSPTSVVIKSIICPDVVWNST